MLIPTRFGEPSKQLFGLYQAPSSGRDREHSVVLCNAFGQEAIRSHRLMRVLGERLARAGFHVLRFDYFGTGDSDGDDEEGNLDRWIDDVLRADAQAVRMSGYRDTSWFGMRLGATLAAAASAKAQRPPSRLVLWDPVVEGRRYLAELARAHVSALVADTDPAADTWAARDPGADGFEQALGFPHPPTLRGQLAALTPATLDTCRAGRATLLTSGSSNGADSAGQVLRGRGMPLEVKAVDAEVVWASDEAMNSAIVPAAALQAVVAALGGEA